MIGQNVSHYKIIEKLGQGGMGVVYKAEDTNLNRQVALKVLPDEFASDPESLARFEREAKLLASLNHPNIASIHGLEQADGIRFLVMELVEGHTLAQRIAKGPLPVDEALEVCRQIAEGLEAAHEKGIVHRDLKPANVQQTPNGTIKILDFGLARAFHNQPSELDQAKSPTISTAMTRPGAVLGTVAYMSPEQAEGKEVDARSDVFAFGVVLYEMLAGRHPFRGQTTLATLTAIMHEQPPPLALPKALAAVIARCLEKNRRRRYPSAAGLVRDIAAVQTCLATRPLWRQPWVAVPALVLLVAAISAGAWLGVRAARVRWARNVALPEIVRLRAQQHLLAALRLTRQAERYLPEEAVLKEIQAELVPTSFRSTPPGADVYCRDYDDTAETSEWEHLGRTPIETISLPPGMRRCRIVKEGLEPVELAHQGNLGDFRLQPRGAQPGMVFVPQGTYNFLRVLQAPIDAFWLDKYEVTNRQYKEFVDRGGYQKRDYWKYPSVKNGRTLAWEQAMAEFRDATGRPGPATWELGTYPEGRADFPVNGVSWYEAAAYADYAGKSLPTVDHWFRAAYPANSTSVIRFSNFGGQGPARVGSYPGLGIFGTYDLGGNVKEWCWNPLGERRYILGGAWSEGTYLYQVPDAASPFERLPTYGFRCAKYLAPPPPALTGPLEFVSRDRTRDKPVGDDIYRVYRGLHSYDRTELKRAVESVDDSSAVWKREKVSFAAAYGNERVIAYLFLPKNAPPPYQTAVFFPGAGAFNVLSSERLADGTAFDFIVRSGRAVVYPVYKGTYERGPGAYYHRFGQPDRWREMNIQWSKDLGRTLDYLETRTDVDPGKLAFLGISLGAAMGPRLTAVETRFQASVLISGGFFERVPPEVDGLNFAPRTKVPTLMVNGRGDFLFPLQTSQLPLFRLLRTPEKDKRHVLFDCNHDVTLAFRQQVIKEVLDWLDRYLGPVALR